ncbi:hypothetical protein [Paenibacillus dendritiformis]|uniref:hypothetical protein n=1 Tax=Paenibacillus dendritiformis TaxID=130049 RepID=UPI0011B5550D|nr:hypothetical protein [Paenibacillus dendritiformis]
MSLPRFLRRPSACPYISYQNTKTWKQSNDPEFETKKRLKSLYNHLPQDGQVIGVDEFGPLEIQPYPGKGSAPPVPSFRTALYCAGQFHHP